jgi:hypothetical protein
MLAFRRHGAGVTLQGRGGVFIPQLMLLAFFLGTEAERGVGFDEGGTDLPLGLSILAGSLLHLEDGQYQNDRRNFKK